MRLYDIQHTVVRSDLISAVWWTSIEPDDRLGITLTLLSEDAQLDLEYEDESTARRDMENLVAAVELHDPVNSSLGTRHSSLP